MEILLKDAAQAFEAANTADLYHYQDVLLAPLTEELRKGVIDARGMFNSVFQHPDYGAESEVNKDRFIVFAHDGQKAVLVLKNGAATLFMQEQPVEVLEAWLWVFVKQYLRAYNPDNLLHFPKLPEAAAPVKKRRTATKKPAVKKPAKKSAGKKTATPKASAAKKPAATKTAKA